MTHRDPIQGGMREVVGLVRRYLEFRLERKSIEVLSHVIHDLRVLLQQVMTNHFLHLPVEKAREFRAALIDQLIGVCNELKEKSDKEETKHHHYCVQEVMVCFEWAEQIMVEVPGDPVTRKVLAIDIPILRPFNYGLKDKKPVSQPKKH